MKNISLLILLILLLQITATESTENSNCTRKCGDIRIPFPFGLRTERDRGCYLPGFGLRCNRTTHPPELYSWDGRLQFLGIDLAGAQATVVTRMSWDCQRSDGLRESFYFSLDITGTPFTVSSDRNVFTTIGCNAVVLFNGTSFDSIPFFTGCVSLCNDNTTVGKGCSGNGCCRASIPHGLQSFQTTIYAFPLKIPYWSVNGSLCSYSFVIERDSHALDFDRGDLFGNNYFLKHERNRVPLVLDWSIGDASCKDAKFRNSTSIFAAASYACVSENSECADSKNGQGYVCNCAAGYQGNPYQQNGCTDIDECAKSFNSSSCFGVCKNLPGNFSCKCPEGTQGNPWTRDGCVHISDNSNKKSIRFITAASLQGGIMFLVIAIVLLWRFLKERTIRKRKQRFYQRNLELLRREQCCSDIDVIERMKIYELDELEKATNNFDKARMVGGGGHGYVYKGILSDQRVVAIKKPKISNQRELGQFINEVFILSQTSHRNVVKLFGCCLETEVPLLVFEFISGGTLTGRLVDHEKFPPFSFQERLRIATDVARALTYLHCEASVTIFHRDVKSSNVLLDEKNVAKLSDFGVSRSVGDLEKNYVSTTVQGTYGYLDPEYHQTGRLTEKSDVYSFGVILAELLTGRLAIPSQNSVAEMRYMVMDFHHALKDGSLHRVLDPLVLEEAAGNSETIERVTKLAGLCLKSNGIDRPTMKEVEDELEAVRLMKQRGIAIHVMRSKIRKRVERS
ncbi:wall-associated receptor kinase 2-like [Curcuma longa]|uniref:wall-associated receptor kinase 2-like n=1 Tax=Curcuma longa TaxID=136217 RepID=UPI003D9F6238